MIDNKYVGFVCQRVNYKDNDAIITILTKNGKHSFKARGINKINSKNGPSSNYFLLSEYVLTSKSELSNKTLKSSNIVKVYKKAFDDLLVSSCYLYICSLLNQVSDEINGYDVAIKCFDKFENNNYPIDVLNYFLKQLLDGLGFKPNISGCVICNKKTNLISFDFEQGGFICKSCYNSNLYNSYPNAFLKDLYNFFKEDEYIELDNQHSIKIFMMYNEFIKKNNLLKIDNYDFILKCL